MADGRENLVAMELMGAVKRYAAEVVRLRKGTSTTEETYYPAIRDFWAAVLEEQKLPFEVRVATSETRGVKAGSDHPDVALYEKGDVLAVCGEVKNPDVEISDLAKSKEQNDQIGRYLAQTGVVLLCNVRAVGLLACKPKYCRETNKPVPSNQRDLLAVVDLWSSDGALKQGKPIQGENIGALAALIERAVTEFAPIADPSSLARILARQARHAKEDLPEKFDTVAQLLEDYRLALGLTFEDEEGAGFFRSSLVQTAFYGLFAGWTLWHRSGDKEPFEWDRLERYLKIPFLGKLFYEFRHPDRLQELGLEKHLDRAAETLGRVDREAFFARFTYSTLEPSEATAALAAITYFYEPFLEAFDPDLRRELGVWYTPPEIVRYQVRKIERLLKEELGCSRGFADERVVVLDPCCGTGAYLLEVTRAIAAELKGRNEKDLLGATILDALSKRIIGFEILTAPFVVAQLQLYLLLADLGVEPGKKQRPAVFLTNALTGWGGPEQIKLHFPELEEERELASNVKRDAKIVVILGNPPYNRFSGVALAEEADLVDHYKGIERKPKKNKKGEIALAQEGPSLLYTRWGIRKQLLDDLYIRFFRLAEERIGEVAEYGIVSFISNSSWLTGRSHPLMRSSLLQHFHKIWIDNTRGYVLANERGPNGEVNESVFSFADAPGIRVGTAISTFLKHKGAKTPPSKPPVYYRDFWGKAAAKRAALLESLEMDRWSKQRKAQAAKLPEGPREFEEYHPVEERRWIFSPGTSEAGYEAWPGLDELFPVTIQGVNPNRGLDGSAIATDRNALAERIRNYLEIRDFSKVAERFPELVEKRARYEPREVWEKLRAQGGFQEKKIVSYLLFPFDLRFLYYETSSKFLNESRPEFERNLKDNLFFVTVLQPRRVSETRPLISRVLVDLHVHDRGSVCFPREVREGTLLMIPSANIAKKAWDFLRKKWGLKGDMSGAAAKGLVERLFHLALAVLHSPGYQVDHKDSLAQDWAHVPIPRDEKVFDEVADAGEGIATLLDAESDPEALITKILGKERMWKLGNPQKAGGGAIRENDLKITVGYFGAAKGKWLERAYRAEEEPLAAWGECTGDLFINEEIYFSNVPERVWRFELGGYPVLKKWLGYRGREKPLTLKEKDHFRSMVQRIAALITLEEALDALYGKAATNAFTAEDLNLR